MADEPTNPPAPAPAAAPASDGQTFSVDYVRELRRENKNLRDRMREGEDKAAAAENSAKEASKNAEKSVAEATKAASQRIARAELKAVAIKAGIVDLDGLKLINQDELKLNDNGDLEGADALIEQLKKDKPYLFGSAASSSTHQAPAKQAPSQKHARDMTAEEYRAERQKLIGKR